ncbi:hypothetical protein [Paracoccus fontiphilus]|uniref:Uncharacterized protein n=1 Tax=Paracoccus fontiphilus TaxID=1815556 RepID=A0ABV7IHK1_9RHOB|nr:hypothetical protein [Paracoccus fontiphilus]
MIPHMMDQFRQSQAAQVEPSRILHAEIKRTVQWQLYHGTEPREAVFVATQHRDGDLMVRLVRVQGDTVSFGRRDALCFEQPVRAWETEAEAAFRAEGAA